MSFYRFDFTFEVYKKLLDVMLSENYFLTSFEDYLNNNLGKVIILRHDVDKKPYNSLKTAIIENQLGIKSSYYFRIVPASNNPEIIYTIKDLGHEIGYHYEDLAFCSGDVSKAFKSFCKNLDYFRKYYPVKTICMHGSPTSKWDNRLIWEKYDYRELGIIGEPYFDIDYKLFFYLTDTGRRWNGDKYSVRDKIKQNFDFDTKSTFDIMELLKQNKLPNKILITTHPQRWNDNQISWIIEYISQNMKNAIKKFLIFKRR